MMESLLKNKDQVIRLVFVLFCGGLAFYPYPPVIGLWEANSIFHTFAPEQIWYNTIIHPRANTGGYEYIAIDLARIVSSVFGFNFFSIRLLPAVYGLFSLFFFYKIIRRWCNEGSSLLTTGLLATNGLFLVFQHQLIVLIVGFLCTLAVCYFYLEANSKPKNVIYFGITCALAALFYHTTRYVMLAFVGIWVIQGIQKNTFKGFLPQLKKFTLSLVITLTVFNPVNLYRFFNYKFLIPEEGGAGANEFAMSISGLLENLKVNLPLTFHSLLGTNDFYGDSISEVLFSVPFPLINVPLLILVLLGLVALLLDCEKKKLLLVLLWVLLTIAIPTISQVWPDIWSSLSPYRQFFGIIPLYLMIGVGIHWIVNVKKFKAAKPLVYFSVTLLIVGQAYIYAQDVQIFKKIVDSNTCELDRNQKFVCKVNNERYLKTKLKEADNFENNNTYYSPFVNGYHFFEDFILPHKAFVSKISKIIEKESRKNMKLLVNIPTTHFVESKGHNYGWNYHQFFLALYLAEESYNVHYFVPYPGEKEPSFSEGFFNFLITRLGMSQSSGGTRLSKHLNYPMNFENFQYNEKACRPFWGKVYQKGLIPRVPDRFHSTINKFYDVFQLSSPVIQCHFIERQTGGGQDVYLVTNALEKKVFLKEFPDYIEIKL